MNYTRLFVSAGNLIWRSRFLLALGFATSLASSIVSASRIMLGARLAGASTNAVTWLTRPELLSPLYDVEPSKVRAWLLWGTVAFLLLFLALWLLAMVAEGAQIRAVMLLQEGQAVTMWQALRDVRRFLGRFVGIDTLIFLPLFLLSLLILVFVMSILIGFVALSMSGTSVAFLSGLLAIAMICLVPLLCLILPSGLLTFLFRTLAFRATVLRNSGVRDSIRHTWRVIKSNAGSLSVLVVLLWGLRFSVSLLLGLGTMPLTGLLGASGRLAINSQPAIVTSRDPVTWIIILAAVGMTVVLNAVINAFSATVWTMAYAEIAGGER